MLKQLVYRFGPAYVFALSLYLAFQYVVVPLHHCQLTYQTHIENSYRYSGDLSTLNVKHLSTSCLKNLTRNIVFLKVHKSGSTTIANILARYALNHDLNVALPNKLPRTPRFNYFSPLHKKQGVLPLAVGQSYNVLFNHMIYNRSSLNRLVPPDTFYCAIMREPLSRFASAARYYPNMLPKQIREYLLRRRGNASVVIRKLSQGIGVISNRGPLRGLAELVRGKNRTRLERSVEIYNSLASGSGMPLRLHMNRSAVQEHIRKLDKELHLVMVMERFVESVVLFKRRACLHVKDILHFQLNPARKNLDLVDLSEAERAFLLSWQMADVLIYDHFHQKFNSEVEKEGASFQQEVQHFRKILAQVENYCHDHVLQQDDVLVIAASPWNDLFTVNSADCALMMMSELRFQHRLVHRAQMRYLRAQNRK